MGLTAPSLLLHTVGGKLIIGLTRMKKDNHFSDKTLRFRLLPHYYNAVVNMG